MGPLAHLQLPAALLRCRHTPLNLANWSHGSRRGRVDKQPIHLMHVLSGRRRRLCHGTRDNSSMSTAIGVHAGCTRLIVA